MLKAIITGHSRGLGAAIAENLLERNIPLLGLSRQAHAELGKRFPDSLEQIQIDLSDTAAITQWINGGRLREFLAGSSTALLINNAGMLQPVGPVGTQDPDAIARAITLNVAAPMMMADAFANAGGDIGDKRILHVSSGAGRNAVPGWSIYGATKAALDHHARAATLDHAPGLRICSLAPGVIDTDMQTEIRASTLDRFPQRARFDALKRDGALADPAVCARQLVDYLLSERFGETAIADLRELAG